MPDVFGGFNTHETDLRRLRRIAFAYPNHPEFAPKVVVLDDHLLPEFQLAVEAAETRTCSTRIQGLRKKDVLSAGLIFSKDSHRNDHFLA